MIGIPNLPKYNTLNELIKTINLIKSYNDPINNPNHPIDFPAKSEYKQLRDYYIIQANKLIDDNSFLKDIINIITH